MKASFFLFAAGLALNSMSFAEEINLNSRSATTSNNATLIRTAESPEKVKLTVSVPMQETVCTKYDQVLVFGPDASCGYEQIFYPCGGGANGRYGRPYGHICYYSRIRSCQHMESRCVQTGIQSYNDTREVTIKFKNNIPAAGKSESYQLTANQRGINARSVDFTLRALNTEAPVEIKELDFIWHKFTVKNSK
jgi:hypothetical protein